MAELRRNDADFVDRMPPVRKGVWSLQPVESPGLPAGCMPFPPPSITLVALRRQEDLHLRVLVDSCSSVYFAGQYW